MKNMIVHVLSSLAILLVFLSLACERYPLFVQPAGEIHAAAGRDRYVSDADGDGREPVLLDGSASRPDSGRIGAYVWTDNGRVCANACTATVILETGRHLLVLSVFAPEGGSSSDTAAADVLPCANPDCGASDYLTRLSCPLEFETLSGLPLYQVYGGVRSVKAVYDIAAQRVFFVNSSRHYLHFDFCSTILGYAKPHATFNREQYTQNPDRLYYLANVNYYKSSDTWALEFWGGDRLAAAQIKTVYAAVADNSYFGTDLRFLPTSTMQADTARSLAGIVPLVDEGEVYAGQEYQALNCTTSCGYLRKIDIRDLARTPLSRRDIVVTNGLPVDIPVVAGIITTVFQTPLSHINVLSRNRGTPNMTLRRAWDDPAITALLGTLVRLEVGPDTFALASVSPESAAAFWNAHEPSFPRLLPCNDSTPGVLDIAQPGATDAALVGAKAANVAQLARIHDPATGDIPLPEGAFAIPFYYYRQHMVRLGLDAMLDAVTADSRFTADAGYRDSQLRRVRDSIVSGPMDPAALLAVTDMIRARGDHPDVRFRSSTNAEDISGFNGAGLYESHTGSQTDPRRSVEYAIKRVWASLWGVRAVDERDYFRIDRRCVAMGVLAHRSFEGELVNGVAITANIYMPQLPGFVINVQDGQSSVVNPQPGFLCDQFIFYTFDDSAFSVPVIEYFSRSNITGGKPVLADAEILQLAGYLWAIKKHFFLLGTGGFGGIGALQAFAMDVEFKFDSPDRKLYIKQARPY